MNRNWFRNEARIMFVVFILPMVLALFVYIYFSYINPITYEAISAEERIKPDFNTGYFFGQIEAIEVNILGTYNDLNYLNNKSFQHESKRIFKKHKIGQLNGELLTIYLMKEHIPTNLDWSNELKMIIIEGNDTRKKIYKEIKQKRIENNWINEDPKDEKKIGEMLDIYIEYGNPYKLK